jgi:hypothetical protein
MSIFEIEGKKPKNYHGPTHYKITDMGFSYVGIHSTKQTKRKTKKRKRR